MRHGFARVIGGAALLALVAVGAAACKKDEGTPSGNAACNLEIGFFGGLTGDNSGLVTPMKQGSDLAIKEYNAAHQDCQVKLTPYDSQGLPDKANGLATDAVNNKNLVAMIGPAFSGESEVANPIFETAGLPAITPSATRPSLSQDGLKIFHRGIGNDLAQGPAAARYIKDVMKAEKVFVVDDQSAYGAGLADQVKEGLGAAVVGSDKVTEKQPDFGGVISKVKASGATVLFYGGYTQEAAPFLKQLRAAGWKGTFMGGDGINDANMLSVTGQQDVEGTVATCPCAPATAAKGTFAADFEKEFGQAPGVYADVAYDVTNIFLEGIAAGKTTRADLLAFLGTYNKAGKASGVTYKWGPEGELDPAEVRVWAYIAKNGEWVPDQEIPKG